MGCCAAEMDAFGRAASACCFWRGGLHVLLIATGKLRPGLRRSVAANDGILVALWYALCRAASHWSPAQAATSYRGVRKKVGTSGLLWFAPSTAPQSASTDDSRIWKWWHPCSRGHYSKPNLILLDPNSTAKTAAPRGVNPHQRGGIGLGLIIFPQGWTRRTWSAVRCSDG